MLVQKAQRHTTIRLRRVITEKEEIKRLKQFEQQYLSDPQRDQARAKLVQNEKNAKENEKNAKEKLSQVKGGLPGQDRVATCEEVKDCQKAQAAASRAINEIQQFLANEQELNDSLAEREKSLAAEEKKLGEEAERLKNVYSEARKRAESQERNVSFELFGLKFKAPILLAPLLWCLFCVALLGYLAIARAKSMACCVQGFRALAQSPPSLSENELTDLAERLPLWAVEPALSAYAATLGPGKNRTQMARELWVNRVFGSSSRRQLVTALAFLIPFLAWITQLRVAWIALELSRHLGTTRMRALLPLALLAILGMTVWIGGWWLFGERVILR